MSEMIERVAKVLFEKAQEAARNVFLAPNYDALASPMKEHYCRAARAAIEAMREPTDEMLEAACDVGIDQPPAAYWPAMIDAALAPPQP